MRQITTELNPTSGSIKIKDVDPFLEPLKVKQLMGVIPQEGALFSHLTVQEHLYFFGRLKGLAKGSGEPNRSGRRVAAVGGAGATLTSRAHG